MITLKNILVPFDFSEYSEQALRYGLELARKFDATLYLLHVVQDPMTQSYAGEVLTLPPVEVVDQWVLDAGEKLTARVPPLDASRVRVRGYCIGNVTVTTVPPVGGQSTSSAPW